MKVKPQAKILFIILLVLIGAFIFIRKNHSTPDNPFVKTDSTSGFVTDTVSITPGTSVQLNTTDSSVIFSPAANTVKEDPHTPSVKPVHHTQSVEPKTQQKEIHHPVKKQIKKPGERENLELSN